MSRKLRSYMRLMNNAAYRAWSKQCDKVDGSALPLYEKWEYWNRLLLPDEWAD